MDEYMWSLEELKSENVTKIRFEYWSNFVALNQDQNKEAKWQFEVNSNGEVYYYAYPHEGQAVIDEDKALISETKIKEFYNNLLELFLPDKALFQTMVHDGLSYELNIIYNDGKIRKFEGDIGGGEVDDTVLNFLRSIPEMREKIRR